MNRMWGYHLQRECINWDTCFGYQLLFKKHSSGHHFCKRRPIALQALILSTFGDQSLIGTVY